jgi:hypothetical protein
MDLTPSQHSSLLLSGKRRVANVCTAAMNANCWDAADRQNAGDSVAKNEQLLFVTLDFKTCRRCNDLRKLLTERNDIIVAKVVFRKAMHEMKQSISDILIITTS